MADPFEDLLVANRKYAASFALAGRTPQARRGVAVLTCMDARIEPLQMLGLVHGDAKILRNAGARATDDAIRSLALATTMLGVNRIMVVAHTGCALANTTDDKLRGKIEDRRVREALDTVPLHAAPDQRAALASDVKRLRTSKMLASGTVVAGFMYDTETGLLARAE